MTSRLDEQQEAAGRGGGITQPGVAAQAVTQAHWQLWLARDRLEQGQHEAALKFLRRAERLAPGHPQVLADFAAAHLARAREVDSSDRQATLETVRGYLDAVRQACAGAHRSNWVLFLRLRELEDAYRALLSC